MTTPLRLAMLAMSAIFINATSMAEPEQDDSSSAVSEDIPAAIKNLENRGVEIIGKLDTPADIDAYAAIAKQQPLAVYLTPDKQHVIIGTLIDEDGHDITYDALQEATVGVWSESTWQTLTDSSWVADGNPNAERIVYMFTDPNCPFCHKFWEQSRPWVDSGAVQLRHILVGMLTETSEGKAAAILASNNPSVALMEHEKKLNQSGIEPLEDIPSDIAEQLKENADVMNDLMITGTPGILYHDSEGQLKIQRGAPLDEDLELILGPKP